MKDKEHDNFMKAKDNYEKMQEMIASGKRFTFHEDLSPRILPRDVQPEVDKRAVEIPVENTQAELPEPKRRTKKTKRPPKRFNMPDGVRTGFTKASRLTDNADGPVVSSEDEAPYKSPSPAPIPPDASVFLTEAETADLERAYLSVSGEGAQVVEGPRLDAFPESQRQMRPTGYLKHGRASTGLVRMLSKMHDLGNMSASTVAGMYEDKLDAEHQEFIDARPEESPTVSSLDDATLFGITSTIDEGRGSPNDGHDIQQSLQSGSQVTDYLDTGSDLADFIDDSEVVAGLDRPSSRSSPPLDKSGASVTEESQLVASSQLSNDIPNLERLLERRASSPPSGPKKSAATRRRRTLIDSDSESDA
jgi:ATP-dependent DNA helicase MPH1